MSRTRARLRRTAVAVTLAVACTDVVAGSVILLDSSQAQPVATPTVTAPAPPTVTPTPTPTSPSVPAPPPSSTPRHKVAHATPDTVWIPSQHVEAPIEVCQIIDNELDPPHTVSHTCYWAGGAKLGAEDGTTVIAGHINWVGQGTGALGNIDKLDRGAVVRTSDSHGVVTKWIVQSVVHRSKSLPIDARAFVGPSGPRTLYLMTCGGAFDAADANYLDNIYVRATPADASAVMSAPRTAGVRPLVQ